LAHIQGVQSDSSDFELHVFSTLENSCCGQLCLYCKLSYFKFFFRFPFTSYTSGVKCTWSGGGILEIDLHHCDNPVHYHVYLNAPRTGINKTLSLKEGDDKELSKNFKIHVTELSRKGNVITTTVSCTSFNMIISIYCN